jgi:hypothetical protein
MTNRRFLATAACGLAFLLTACATTHKEDPAQCKAVKPGEVTSINNMCVIENEDPVDPAITPVVFKGQKIGFCCSGCIKQWNGMTDAQKQAAVEKALAAKPGA